LLYDFVIQTTLSKPHMIDSPAAVRSLMHSATSVANITSLKMY